MSNPRAIEEPTLAFILDLERQVWEALKSGNREADARLLSDEFVGVYASGVQCSLKRGLAHHEPLYTPTKDLQKRVLALDYPMPIYP